MPSIRVAVFPAAGLGTRFLPATKAQPKEMLPLVDRPLVQYVVEEATAAGLERIVIVTGRGKNAIEDHFDTSFELERMLEERGKTELLEDTAPDVAGEIQLTSALKTLLRRRPIDGYLFEGRRYDAGDKLGFLEATVEFALKRKDLGEAFRKYLKSLKL